MSFQTISPQQLMKLKPAKKPVVIDVRTSAEVSHELFDNSVNLPLQELTFDQFKKALVSAECAEFDPVYLLCGSGMLASKATRSTGAQYYQPSGGY